MGISKNKNRNLSLDLVKVIAMIGVVALHCQLYIPREYSSTFYLSTLASGFPIPLFFMVSGYLMFSREPNVGYAVKKILKILRFLIEFVGIFWLLTCMPKGSSIINWPKFVALSMLQEGPLPVFWYFGAMCILYALLPLLLYLDRRFPKFLIIFVASLFVIVNLVFVLNCMVGLDQEIHQSLRVWNWLFYFSLGGLLLKHKSSFSKMKVRFWYILLLAMCYTIFYSVVKSHFPIMKNTDLCYGNVICTLYALSLFVYCMQHTINKSNIISQLSPLFLPVYSLHLFVYEYYFDYVNLGILGEVSPFIDFILVALATICISWCIMRTPILNRIFRI